MTEKYKIAIVGLGYVGLPLAILFSRKYHVVGFDIDKNRINQLKKGEDINNEFSFSELSSLSIIYTSDLNKIKSCNIFIITV